ncbi:hypothetical protein [Brevundimonas sp. 374]|uniref:hypothetical protein n=1 Tax=Brevundimonas sp. 374 TaxID=1150400 RepID=UPI0008906283|nr:hypothetical protein [Brevundimonas sp. 374]SDQ41346.1 hypothetical protein SAMN02787020_1210 [Brevundimonas sp. 374]
MIAAAFALLILQQAAPTVVWDAPAPEAVVETPTPPFEHNVPAWGLADPFGFERARCSPLVRGQQSMAECQTEVREQLAIAMGSDLPEALRPSGMAGDCQMIRASAAGSDYAVQCGAQSRTAAAPSSLREMDCRPRPVEGGFSSECRPVDGADKKGLSLTLWGDKD